MLWKYLSSADKLTQVNRGGLFSMTSNKRKKGQQAETRMHEFPCVNTRKNFRTVRVMEP